ncbi:MAG TPA: hypothetical protein VE398_02825 [Acidobacteriota bacterium]|nr:hypothetical protein [Acidobacteriota bacterium]
MRILLFCSEGYPVGNSTSYALLHQSMALADMGHDVHLYNLNRRPIRLTDYLDAYEFDLVIIDVDHLRSEETWRSLRQYRRTTALRAVGVLYTLPPPPERVWEVLDLAYTPWKGKTFLSLARTVDIRYLPFGYNASLHRRRRDVRQLGPVFVGNTTGGRHAEAQEYLGELSEQRVVLCVGPGFTQDYLDPFVLGGIYSAARCLPNFHYSWAKAEDMILNERFWQSARCGVPVNDYHPLMDEVLEESLVASFCFRDRLEWQDRVRRMNTEEAPVPADILVRLDTALAGNSYHDRMRQLLDWLA